MKRQLTAEEIKTICANIVNKQYEDSCSNIEFGSKCTYITVDEYEDGCKAFWSYYEDAPKSSASCGKVNHELTVGPYKLLFTMIKNEISGLSTPQDADFALPDDDKLIDELENCITNEMPFDSEIDGSKLFYNEWSIDELIDEIESLLSYDTYIEIDDVIYPIEDSIEEFIEDYCDDYDDEPDYIELSPSEVAERLADEIEFL